MLGKYQVAHLIGITRDHEQKFRECEISLTKQGYICFSPVIYNFEEYKKNAEIIDDMCAAKLFISDCCVLVTPEHIGVSTNNRIIECLSMNKPVYIWKNNEISETIRTIGYYELWKQKKED